MDLIPLLMKFNLTQQEAAIYLTLYKSEALTGYEITKMTGISRSNVYSGLQNLVDKGAIRLIEEKALKYTANDINVFCDGVLRDLGMTKDMLITNMPDKTEPAGRYITITGDSNILNMMFELLEKTTKRVYISMSNGLVNLISEDLKKLIDNGIKVVIITDGKVNLECRQIYLSRKKQNQIRLISDSQYVLTGEFSKMFNIANPTEVHKESSCLYSTNTNLVTLFKESMHNEIQLIELGQEV